MKPSYTFIDHTADVLFRAKAATLSELFEQCALALEDTQVDLQKIKPRKTITITGQNSKIDRLLFDFLDDLIYYKDADSLVFNNFKVNITEKNKIYHLTCQATGETLDHAQHDPKVDVKAVTMHLFEVKKVKDHWEAQVLVDI